MSESARRIGDAFMEGAVEIDRLRKELAEAVQLLDEVSLYQFKGYTDWLKRRDDFVERHTKTY